MLGCLHKEIAMHPVSSNAEICGMFLDNREVIETLYFGGGTPSILSGSEITGLIESVKKNYTLSGEAEITLEANPDDITPEKLAELKKAGINRFSLGIQAFDDENLKWMNRAHNTSQAENSLKWIREAGFGNYSVDLIFGLPRLNDKQWNENIEKVIEARVPHVACYALTVEPKTALYGMIRLGKKEDINQEDQARQFEILMKRLRESGYEHYEISNFSLPGFRSRHNSSYWQQKRYLGIGPSAHSYDGTSRFWNVANNPLYIKSVNEGNPFFEKEDLTEIQKLDEYIMTSLRTSEGMDLNHLKEAFGSTLYEKTKDKISKVNIEWYLIENDRFILTDKGRLFADHISVIFFE